MEQENFRENVSFELEEVNTLLREKNYSKLREYLIGTNPVDTALIINELEDVKDALLVFRMLPKEDASTVFAYLEGENRLSIIENVSEKELKSIMQELYFDDKIDMIEEMPAGYVDKILRNITPDERSLVNEFLMYPEDSAGSLMTIEYVSINENYTVERALTYLHEVGLKKETIYTCYVTDRNLKLIGLVSLRSLVLSAPDVKIKDIMEQDVISLDTDDDQEYVADQFSKYDFISMPVVDKTHKLVGIVTFDDIVHVVEEETTEDFHKMAAITPTDTPYLETSSGSIAKSRLPWLLFLMLSATLTSTVIKLNFAIIAQFAILPVLMPMLTDTGGNAASQSSTLVIRGLATGEIEDKDWKKILVKEFFVSLITSAVLILVISVRVVIIERESFIVSLTVSLALIFTVFASNFIGCMLPIGAKKLGLDPATMAVPLITTIVDASSLIIYFSIAKSILL